MVGNLPIKKWRSGAIEGAIWSNKRKIFRNDGEEEVEFKTFTIRRSWKDKKEDIWRDEKINLRRQDIPKLQAILSKIHEELFLSGDGRGDDDE